MDYRKGFMRCECGNEKFFSRYENNKRIALVCSVCRKEQPIKKESRKKSPSYNIDDKGEQ